MALHPQKDAPNTTTAVAPHGFRITLVSSFLFQQFISTVME
jgi:hypothetical protein